MAKRRRRTKKGWRARLRRIAVRIVVACGALALAWWLLCAVVLLGLRWIDPPTTVVQMQRRVESWFREVSYDKRSTFVPLERIDDNLEWAVVAAEDTRFYEHGGIDWSAIGDALDEGRNGKRVRGGSTLTQQLVKNLFLSTRRSFLRKVAEVPLTYTAEAVLPKRRILELYLNVVEWGDGVYGAEAAARHHYGVPCSALGRERSARLAAVLPAPRQRRPDRMNRYAEIIQQRMTTLGH